MSPKSILPYQLNRLTKRWNISNIYPNSFWEQTVSFAILILAGTIFNLHHWRIWFIRIPEQLWNVWIFRFCFQWGQIPCRRWFKEPHCDWNCTYWVWFIPQKLSVKVNEWYFAVTRCRVVVSIKWGSIASFQQQANCFKMRTGLLFMLHFCFFRLGA